MDSGTLQTLEIIGWGVLMWWLFTATKSARKSAEDVREKREAESTAAKSTEGQE